MLIDSTLSWKNHLTELSKNLARTAGIFYKIRHYAPKDTLILLYHAVFAPFLPHFVSIWDLTHTSLLDPVFVSQKKVLRIIVFSENAAPSAPIFNSFRILKLNDITTRQITLLCLNVCITLLLHTFVVILPVYRRKNT